MKKKEVICYSHQLGNCSDVQSEEHYFTQGMFSTKMITITGQRWLSGQSKLISKKTLGLKILCQKHNEELGKSVDKEAIKLFRLIEEFFKGTIKRANSPRWKPIAKKHVKVSGQFLERWMIKYLLGAVFEEPGNRWHPNGAEQVNPPLAALESLFNSKPLKYPMGIYHIGAIKQEEQVEERLGIGILFHPHSKMVVGGTINLRNLNFLIWLSEDEFTKYEFLSDRNILFGPDDEHEKAQYHLEKLTFTSKGWISGIFEIEW